MPSEKCQVQSDRAATTLTATNRHQRVAPPSVVTDASAFTFALGTDHLSLGTDLNRVIRHSRTTHALFLRRARRFPHGHPVIPAAGEACH